MVWMPRRLKPKPGGCLVGVARVALSQRGAQRGGSAAKAHLSEMGPCAREEKQKARREQRYLVKVAWGVCEDLALRLGKNRLGRRLASTNGL
jgi:hypothetical protein